MKVKILEKFRKFLSFTLALFMVLGTAQPVRFGAIEAEAAEKDSIQIIDTTYKANKDYSGMGQSYYSKWARRNEWISKAGIQPGVLDNKPGYFLPGGRYIWNYNRRQYENDANFLLSSMYKKNGKWVFCFDHTTDAKGSRVILDKLPAGYNLMSEAQVKEMAAVIAALFPNSTNTEVLASNVGSFFKSAYRDQARKTLRSSDGEFLAAVLMQVMVWQKVHNLRYCNLNGSYRVGLPGFDEKTNTNFGAGNWRRDINKSLCEVIDLQKLYAFGLTLSRKGGQCANVDPIVLEYGKEKVIRGEQATAIRELKKENKIPAGITFKENGGSVSLTSTMSVGKDFGTLTTSASIRNKFSASNPYAKGSHGQLLVYTYQMTPYCIRLKTKDGFGNIQVEKKVDKDSGQPISGVKYGIYADKAAKQKVAEMVTDSKGRAVSTLKDKLKVNSTYYVRELSEAEGQIKGIIPDKNIYSVVPKSPTAPVKIKFGNSTVHHNVMQTFGMNFNKKDVLKVDKGKLNFENTKYKVRVNSLVKDIKAPKFKIGAFVKESNDGKNDAIYSTKNDQITIDKLQLGNYTLVEYSVDPKSDALLSPTGDEITFESVKNADGTFSGKVVKNNTKDNAYARQAKVFKALGWELTAPDSWDEATWGEEIKVGQLRVVKLTDPTGQPLKNFTFTVSGRGIWNGDKDPAHPWVSSRDFTTDEKGQVLTTPLLLGNYDITEKSGTVNFIIPENNVQTKTVTQAASSDNAVVAEFKNEQQLMNFDVQKVFGTHASGDAVVAGAKFEVKVKSLEVEGIKGQKQPGEVVGTYTTDEKGFIHLKDMPIGEYEIREISESKGTNLTPSVVYVKGTFENTPSGRGQKKYTSLVEYDFSNARNSVNEAINQLGIKLNSVWNAQLDVDKIGSKQFTQEEMGILATENDGNKFPQLPIFGRIEVNKHMDVNPDLETETKPQENNITFKVYKDSVKEENLYDTFKTNWQGRGASKWLPYGKYVLTQFNTTIKDGKPYVTKVKDIPFTIDKHGEVKHYTIENAQLRMRLQIQKIDEKTGKNILQKGVKFQLFDSNGKLVKFTQYYPEAKELTEIEMDGAKGKGITIDKIPGGKYYLKEVAGPEGYHYDPEQKFEVNMPYDDAYENGKIPVVTITIGSKEEKVVDKDVKNKPQYGQLELNKIGEVLKSWGTKDKTVKVQEQGKVETKEVSKPQANVNLVLKSVRTETVVEDMTEQDGIGTIEDETNPPSVGEKKTREVTRQVERQENVKTDAKGKFSKSIGEGTWTVYDANGKVLASKTVAKGQTDVIEVQLPDIKSTEEVRHDGKVVDKTYIYNVPVYKKDFIGRAKFEFKAKDDIMSYDKQTKFFNKGDKIPFAQKDIVLKGKKVYEKGDVITIPNLPEEVMKNKELVDYFVKTVDGKSIKLDKFPLGVYSYKEIETPHGYKLDQKEREVKFTPQEYKKVIDLQETEMIENFRQKLNLKLNKKVVEETKYFGRGGYEGIVFGIYNKKDIKGLKAGSLIGVVTPDANGVLSFEDVPESEYYFKEISTKDAYKLNENEYSINASHDFNPTEDKEETVNKEVPNKPKDGKEIKLVKVDVKTGKPIEGVGFKLFAVTNDGVKIPVKNGESDIFTTDKDGVIKVGNLPYGNYVWEEFKPQDGYVNEDLVYHVAVDDKSNLEIVSENSPTDIGFRKYDIQTGEPVKGAHLRLEVNVGGDKWEVVKVDKEGYVSKDGKPLEWISDGSLKKVYGLSLDKDYRLVEVNAPKGYSKAEAMAFKISNEKGIQLQGLANQRTRVLIKKIDESSKKPLYGATLELYEDGSDKVFVDPVTKKEAKWVTSEENKDGYLVHGLEVGKVYNVKETVIPKGYNKPYYRYAMLVVDTKNVQTFTFKNEPTPEIKTEAFFSNGVKEDSINEKTKIIDKVHLKKLVVGETYTAKGTLVAQDDPNKVLSKAEKKFVADKTEMDVEVEFEVNAKELMGTTAVVFEDLYRDERRVATHFEITDEDQTVYFPKVKTTATDKVDGGKDALASKEVTIVDKVEYTNLKPGQEYTVKGKMMVKETGKELLVNGKPVVAEKKFVAEKANGFVELEFKFDGSALEGKSVVVFEDLYNGKVNVATHSEIEDEGQTVEIPKVRTTAKDKKSGKQVINPVGTKTIVDVVKYSNLIIGKEYEVKGTLMDKATGKPVLVDGKEVKASKKFVAETKDGSVELEFVVDASALVGKTTVVFEDLFREGKLVGTHSDLTDEDQTIYFPKAKTKVSKSTIKADKNATIVDTLSYTNLQVGKEYTVKGILMDKSTGKPILVNGKEVTAEGKFVAKTENGTFDLTFNFDASSLGGKDIVVFEEVYLDGELVAEHKDINSKEQTFHVEEKRRKPKTGLKMDNPYILGGVGIAGIIIAGCVVGYLRKKRVK